MNVPSVTVLLASYNGADYIHEQLSSVLASEEVNVRVVVRDDGSTDDTVAIVEQFAPRVELIQRRRGESGGSHVANFAALCDYALRETKTDYYAFCDQDDVWFKDKLAILVTEIKNSERTAKRPVLVHCDLQVTNAELAPLADSYWRYQGLPNPAYQRLNKLMYQNVVTGCACLFNRALLERATPVPSQAAVHDYWFGLVAEAIGEVRFIDRALLAYRQHGANSIGSVAYQDQRSYFKKFFYQMLWRFPANLAASQRQIRALLLRFGNEVNNKPTLEAFAYLENQGAIARLREGHRLMETKGKSMGERLYLSWVFLILNRVHRKHRL